MTTGVVHAERRGAVAFVTFDRPAARNAMTWPMYDQLHAACEWVDSEDGIRAAVLRGAGGKAFVAGTDIATFTGFTSGEDGLAYEQRIERVVGRLEQVRVPTLAVVEGYAVGGGLALAAACDVRVCTPDAKFGVPVARTLGNCLSMGNVARLVAALGAARVKALVLLASTLDADEARASGFVTEVVDPPALDDRVTALTERLAAHAPKTMWATKEAVRRLTLASLPEADDLVRECYGSEDFREGVTAFLAKRPPRWQNR